jgi:hypothetical protein
MSTSQLARATAAGSNGPVAWSLTRALCRMAATGDDAHARFAPNHQPEDCAAFRAFERSHLVPVSHRRDADERSLDMTRDAFGLDIHGLFPPVGASSAEH